MSKVTYNESIPSEVMNKFKIIFFAWDSKPSLFPVYNKKNVEKIRDLFGIANPISELIDDLIEITIPEYFKFYNNISAELRPQLVEFIRQKDFYSQSRQFVNEYGCYFRIKHNVVLWRVIRTGKIDFKLMDSQFSSFSRLKRIANIYRRGRAWKTALVLKTTFKPGSILLPIEAIFRNQAEYILLPLSIHPHYVKVVGECNKFIELEIGPSN